MITYKSLGLVDTQENDILNVMVSDKDTVKLLSTYFQNDDEFTLSYSNVIKLRELLDQAIAIMNQ